MIRVLIVSDIRLYREGLAQVLSRDDRLHVIGAHGTLADSPALRGDATPDVILLDMANHDALASMRTIGSVFPDVKVVALGVAPRDGDVIACAEAGVAGYVFRDASLEELFATVESAARGELRCSPEMAATLLRRVANLAARQSGARDARVTRREREILDLVDQGFSNKQIAARLFIEIATVKNHVHNILEKLGVRTRGEAAAKMRRRRSLQISGEHRSPMD